MKNKIPEQPIPPVLINRVLIVIIVALAIFAGYFHARYTNEEKKYARLLIKFQDLKTATTSAQPATRVE